MTPITLWAQIVNAKVVLEYDYEKQQWGATIIKGTQKTISVEASPEEREHPTQTAKPVIAYGLDPQDSLQRLCKELAGKRVVFGKEFYSEQTQFVPVDISLV